MNGLRVSNGLLMALMPLVTSGCTAIASRVATHLTEQQLAKTAEVTIIQGDIARLRSCLRARGGSCEGTVTTPLNASLTATPELAPLAGTLGPQRSEPPPMDQARHLRSF